MVGVTIGVLVYLSEPIDIYAFGVSRKDGWTVTFTAADGPWHVDQ